MTRRTQPQKEVGNRSDRPQSTTKQCKREIIATYRYTDAESQLQLQVVYTNPRGFYPQRPDGSGGYACELSVVPLLIYQPPEMQNAETSGRTEYAPEGDQHEVQLAAPGRTATCNLDSAGKWLTQQADKLSGAHVAILKMPDKACQDYTQEVAASQKGRAKSVRIVNLSTNDDVSNSLDSGTTIDDLERLAKSTPEWTPPSETVDSSCTVPLTPSGELARRAHSEQVAQDRVPRMMGKWSKSGVPKRGWTCTGVKDLGAPRAVCGMCETRQIRYVHCMEHPEYPGEIEAGCVCAEHMEQDGLAARTRSKEIRNLARRRRYWLNRKWKLSPDGSSHIKTRDGYRIVVFLTKNDKWSAKITSMNSDQCYSLQIVYDTQDQAKMASFDYIYYRNR